MILGGKISIYVLNKKSEEGDETVPLDQIGALNEKGQLDRSKLGIFVTHLGKDRKSIRMIVKWLWRFQMNLYYVDFGKNMYFGFFNAKNFTWLWCKERLVHFQVQECRSEMWR